MRSANTVLHWERMVGSTSAGRCETMHSDFTRRVRLQTCKLSLRYSRLGLTQLDVGIEASVDALASDIENALSLSQRLFRDVGKRDGAIQIQIGL